MKKVVAFKKLLEEHCPHLSAARRMELTTQFLASTDPLEPMLYKDRPAGEDFPTWWKREYAVRLGPDGRPLLKTMTYMALMKVDPEAARMYARSVHNGVVPEDLRMPIARPGPKPKEKRQLGM